MPYLGPKPVNVRSASSLIVDGNLTAGGTGTFGDDVDVTGAITPTNGVYLGGTGAANLLDDYEEGTFTPVAIGTSSSGTATYSQQRGFYVKFGRSVHYQIYIGWSGHTGTGDLRFGGLPFAAGSSASISYSAPSVSYTNGLTFGAGQLGGYVVSNGTEFVITLSNSNSTPSAVSVDTSVTEMIINGVYAIA